MPAVIPSPTVGVWHLGPVPIRAYALCILAGIVVAIVLGELRWRRRGGRPGVVMDVAVWAVPFGVIGGRIYHVLTSFNDYFAPGKDALKAFRIWEGGLGIWGAIVLGGVGAWIGCRRAGVRLPPFGDTVAPGIVLAQAIGRWGNWFNNELYGRVTDLPWGLRVYEMDHSTGRVYLNTDGTPQLMDNRDVFYHPTFLYESLWNIGVFVALIWADRRFRLGHGRLFALYVVLYTAGRGWIEALRDDPSEYVLGLRLNIWTSAAVFLGGLVYLVVSRRLRPGRETDLDRGTAGAAAAAPGEGDPAAGTTAEGMVGSMSGSSGDAGTFRPGDPGTGSLGTGHDGAGRSGDGGSPGGSVPGAR
ncbi:MAG: prolipoprotein diacylglyceryl transferase [Actinomycetales bacterium]|nr:prolipoprotein diacylglyceryl transferase [Actinomycetales bacterium]